MRRNPYRQTPQDRTAPSPVAEAIEKAVQLSKHNVFLRADFTNLGSYNAIGRALRRMINEGKLLRIGWTLAT